MHDPPLILAVDDTPENLEILRVRLEAQGYAVADAVDGEDGLAKARELRPDLILLDIMMPRLDGIGAVRELKADPDLRSTPVILVTAKADTKDVVQGLDAGGDDYLTKPFEHAALLARVRSLLRQKALHDTVQEQASQLAHWNAELENRVSAQVDEIARIGRLRRFLRISNGLGFLSRAQHPDSTAAVGETLPTATRDQRPLWPVPARKQTVCLRPDPDIVTYLLEVRAGSKAGMSPAAE